MMLNVVFFYSSFFDASPNNYDVCKTILFFFWDAFLHVCINGPAPESKEGQTIIKAAVDSWLKAKNRRKVAKVNKISGACGVVVKETLNDNVISQDASVQTEENPVIVEAQEVLSEVRQAMKVMAIENENDSDFEDESDFEDDCCW